MQDDYHQSKFSLIIENIFGLIPKEKFISQLTKEKESLLNDKINFLNNEHEEKLDIKRIELSRMLNKFLILVSNKFENIRVVYGYEIVENGNNLQLECIDVMNGKLFIPDGKLFVYTEQKFNILNKMKPLDRIAILFCQEHEIEVEDKNINLEPYDFWALDVKEAMMKFQTAIESKKN